MSSLYSPLLHTHSMLRWVALILLVIATVKFLLGWLGNKSFSAGDVKLRLFTLISIHLQLVLGLVLYFISPTVQFNDHTMSSPTLRFWSVEHISMMLVSVVLITIGHSRSKKIADGAKQNKTLAIFFGIALVLILAAIPWPFRAEIGRPLFPGM